MNIKYIRHNLITNQARVLECRLISKRQKQNIDNIKTDAAKYDRVINSKLQKIYDGFGKGEKLPTSKVLEQIE